MGSSKATVVDDVVARAIEETKNKQDDVDGDDDKNAFHNTRAFSALIGIFAGIIISIVFGAIIIGAQQTYANRRVNAYLNLVPKEHYHHFNFDKIYHSNCSPSSLEMSDKVIDNHNVKCTCDYTQQWECKCDIKPEFVITHSRISCYVLDVFYFDLHHKLFYQENYTPLRTFAQVINPNDCKLHIFYSYHPELEVKPKPKHSCPPITKEDFESSLCTPLPSPPKEDSNARKVELGLCSEMDVCDPPKKDNPCVPGEGGLCTRPKQPENIICPEFGFCYDANKPNPNPPVRFLNTNNVSRLTEAFNTAFGLSLIVFFCGVILSIAYFIYEVICYIARRIFL
jgi:hypothetical protein